MEKIPFHAFVHESTRKDRSDQSFLKITIKRFCMNKLAVIGFLALVVIIFGSLFAPFLVSHNPAAQNLMERLQPPSSMHWFGTDEYGRDIFSRVFYGARVSLLVGFASVLGGIFVGTMIGAMAGFYGGWVDNILMRMVDLVNAFPSIFLLITIVTLLEPSLTNIVIVFILLGWTGTARLVRGEFLKIRQEEYIWAAKSIGMSNLRIMLFHMLPNAIGPIIVAATLGVGGVILAESGLSFLGLGIQPPTPSWGNMLQGAQSLSIMVMAPWYPFFPGLMILITVLAFNFVGDGLRDAMDPKLDGRR
ncbi:oligopeptide ABC transporter permease [Ammoniphilus resinae]|uniref:Peptide/nickel transport system permease protein n=1 Tax=Ammoniphilus resinae TaxID=861532 RepID=A0ABS4GSB7_9BACL|nr:oligopeptide ABC transporter permease [Ammoniphilus resinae]MBP1932932.1 peptide/nickel transport system permease protein [Ammoniphilus resinae]